MPATYGKYGTYRKVRVPLPVYRDHQGNRITPSEADRQIREAADKFFASRGMVRGDGSFKLGRAK